MKLLKLNGFIHVYTSIYWNISSNEIHVFTDSGRIVRPIFVLFQGYNRLIHSEEQVLEWNQVIFGYM